MTASKSIRSFNDRNKPADKLVEITNCQSCGAKFHEAMTINERFGRSRVLCSICYNTEEIRYEDD